MSNAKPLLSGIVLLLVGYVLYTLAFGALPNLQHRSLVLIGCVAMAVMAFPALRSTFAPAGRAIDLILFGVAAAAAVYVLVNYWDIMLIPGRPTTVEMLLGGGLILTILELSRRCLGWSFTILVALFAGYALFGDLLPGRLGHGGASLSTLVNLSYLSTDGVLGGLFGIFANLLIPFIVFSGLMLATGAGDALLDVAKFVGGRMRGGPAKISVISSAFVGSMTGSSVTNVAMTGNFTIPLMKRLGYRPEVAGGIEATASSGGQITPPLMGAGLFLMAELLRVPVTDMMLIALVPAGLFYVGVLASVHFESVRAGVTALPAEEIPAAAHLRSFSVWGPLLLPFGALIGLLIVGYSVGYALLAAIGTLVTLYLVTARSTSELSRRLVSLFQSLADMAKPIAVLGLLCAAAGLLVAVIGYVGVGVKMSELVLSLGAGNLLLTLILAAIVIMIIGMGMPTTAAYLLAASVIAAAFDQLGISDIQAHMFIFYFATLSAITPPICAAAYVAAGLAGAHWFRVALQSVRFAAIKYLLPFLFVFQPALVLQGTSFEVAWAFVLCAVGAIYLSAALAGQLVSRLSTGPRVVAGIGALLCFWPEELIAISGLVILLALTTWQLVTVRYRQTDLA